MEVLLICCAEHYCSFGFFHARLLPFVCCEMKKALCDVLFLGVKYIFACGTINCLFTSQLSSKLCIMATKRNLLIHVFMAE